MNTDAKSNSKPSLTSIYNQVTEIRNRMSTLSSRLNDAHELQPCEVDKASAINTTPDYSLTSINEKVSSIEYYLRQCEDTLTKIVG